MAFVVKLLPIIAAAGLATAGPTSTRGPTPTQDSYYPQQPSVEEIPSLQIPTHLQLPKTEEAAVPFYAPDLLTILKAPEFNPEPDYYAVPIPAQDLIAPVETAWNPDQDPRYYYTLPTNYQKSTNTFPKKFDKDIHSKSKPFSSKPKYEIELEAVDEHQHNRKQKELHKELDKTAKKENQEQIKDIQVQEPKAEASGFYGGFDSNGVNHHVGDRGLSSQLVSSLGINHSPKSEHERLEFHMVGHDGPHSYKWGYDTGKGHNRQFRYEEKDHEGIVKGHFGFYDKHGKLQMVHYDAFPHEGYHAEGNFGKY